MSVGTKKGYFGEFVTDGKSHPVKESEIKNT